MASSRVFSTDDELANYKKSLETLLWNSTKKIQVLEEEKKTENADSDLDTEIKELHDNVLAIKTALKDVELLQSTVKLVTLSSEIIEGQKELEDYQQDICVLKKKKAAVKMMLSDTQDQRMDKDIMICELQHQIQQLSLVNICPFEIDETADAKSNSDETADAKGDSAGPDETPDTKPSPDETPDTKPSPDETPDAKRSSAGSSHDEISDAKNSSQHVSSPN